MEGTERQDQQGGGMPRVIAWIGVALSIFMIVLALSALAGCKVGLHDPCQGHGGTVNVNKGLYTCADGTAV